MINIQEIYIRASILHDDNRRELLLGDCRSNGNNGSVTYRPNEGTAIGSVDGTPVTISPKAGLFMATVGNISLTGTFRTKKPWVRIRMSGSSGEKILDFYCHRYTISSSDAAWFKKGGKRYGVRIFKGDGLNRLLQFLTLGLYRPRFKSILPFPELMLTEKEHAAVFSVATALQLVYFPFDYDAHSP